MDYISRATAADGQIRAFAAYTKDIVEKARSIHNTSPVATAALGRTLTAGVMMGCMMKGDRDVLTILVKGDGPIGGITVTADSKGGVKGYVNNPEVLIHAKENGKLDVGGAVGRGILTVIRDLGLKEPYTGQVDLVSGELGEDFTYYFTVSEQTPSSVGLGVLLNKDNFVEEAGGFIIQLMPGTQDAVIDVLEKNLAGVNSVTNMLKSGMTPEDIIDKLLRGLDPEILERNDNIAYRCNCSEERMAKALISLGRKELASLAEGNEPIELNCQFCGTSYSFSPDEVKEMLRVAE